MKAIDPGNDEIKLTDMEYKIKSFLNIFANKLTGSMEISGQQAMSLLLNKSSCQSSHSFWNLYMTAAMNFVKESFEQYSSNIISKQKESDDQDNILSIGKDNESELTFEERIEKITKNELLFDFYLTPEFTSQMDVPKTDNSQNSSQPSIQFKTAIDINCDFADKYSQDYQEAEADYHTIAVIDGKKFLINQHQHYAYRSKELSYLCLYDYCACIVILPIPKKISKK
jgi:hypothetical protein